MFKQSHASLLLSKVERGRFAFAGALDLLELSGGAQLIITPLMLICVDPQRTRHAMWTLHMRLVLSAQMATPEERAVLTVQLEVPLQPLRLKPSCEPLCVAHRGVRLPWCETTVCVARG